MGENVDEMQNFSRVLPSWTLAERETNPIK